MNKLREVRFETKITQVQISQLTGIPQPRISFIENGLWNPSEIEKIKIANALGIEKTQLFPEENSKQRNTS